MDARAAKLALARKKLKDHQEKKHQDNSSNIEQNNTNDQIVTNNEKTNQIAQIRDGQPTTVPQPEGSNDNFNKQPLEVTQNEMVSNYYTPNVDVNATEILVASKRNLELQINALQAKIADLENQIATTTHKYDTSCQKIIYLENELTNTNYKNHAATEQLVVKDASIKELSDLKSSLLETNENLKEQLELTKSIFTAKEAENDSLRRQLSDVQNQLDAALLQMQQMTCGVHANESEDEIHSFRQENQALLQKISNIEQQLKTQIKDYQQLNNHYEHYMEDLNKQLKQVKNKNDELIQEIINLSNRENSLIEQISDMEIRLQNYKKVEYMVQNQNTFDTTEFNELRSNYEKSQQTLADLSAKYADLQNLYAESRAEIDRLTHSKVADVDAASEHASLLKLNADITSDKIAAQRATEQNKKLKQDIQGLEDAFVKMTKDKLELTEKIAAEKFLNRELTIKLAEIDEKANDMQKKIKAKDEEMIRLQTSYRIVEEKYNEIAENLRHLNGHPDSPVNNESENEDNLTNKEENHIHPDSPDHSECQENNNTVECKKAQESAGIPNSNAMLKLQERFLKIMDEVADLSDEKHRLEHIITQLQNETDTICEYVALYQQQRCLLKKRDEERTTQMKMFQSECTRLQNQLNELTGIITRFAEDTELSSYFQVETKHEDIQKVMKLLSKLKTNSLVDPQKSMKFNDAYPCSCCSGQLIEV